MTENHDGDEFQPDPTAEKPLPEGVSLDALDDDEELDEDEDEPWSPWPDKFRRSPRDSNRATLRMDVAAVLFWPHRAFLAVAARGVPIRRVALGTDHR